MNIENLIKEKVEELNIENLVRLEIKKIIYEDVQKEIKVKLSEQINDLIKKEIEAILKSKVETDDGWGDKKTYDSFEDLFKMHFKKALDNTYDMKRNIERHIKDETEKLVKLKTQEITDFLKKSFDTNKNLV